MNDTPMPDAGPPSGTALTETGDVSVQVVHEGGETVVYVRGEIDMSTCEDLRDAIEPLLAPRQVLVLDLSGVSFMDSACIATLVRARSTLTADGGSLLLRNPSNAARRLLTVAAANDLARAVVA